MNRCSAGASRSNSPGASSGSGSKTSTLHNGQHPWRSVNHSCMHSRWKACLHLGSKVSFSPNSNSSMQMAHDVEIVSRSLLDSKGVILPLPDSVVPIGVDDASRVGAAVEPCPTSAGGTTTSGSAEKIGLEVVEEESSFTFPSDAAISGAV